MARSRRLLEKQRIHWCKPCGYWQGSFANAKGDRSYCPKCTKKLILCASRQWIIDNVDKKFEGIPMDEASIFGKDGWV